MSRFFGGYLHQNWPVDYATPELAVDAAIAEAIAASRVDLLQQVRRELTALLKETEEDTRLRVLLNDGLGVSVFFKHPVEARAFAEEVEHRLLDEIRGTSLRKPDHERHA